MSQKKTITLTDYFCKTYLNGLVVVNFSKQIEEWCILGIENQLGKDQQLKSKLLQSHNEIGVLQVQINKLNATIGKIRLEKMSKESLQLEKQVELDKYSNIPYSMREIYKARDHKREERKLKEEEEVHEGK